MDVKAFVTAGAVVLVGAGLVLLGADIIPQHLVKANVPNWLTVVLGLVLILAGASVFIGIGSPISTRLIGVSLLLMALAFAWVTLFGDPRHMVGGGPFIPDEYSRFFGRFAFGLIALLFLWLGVMALKHA